MRREGNKDYDMIVILGPYAVLYHQVSGARSLVPPL